MYLASDTLLHTSVCELLLELHNKDRDRQRQTDTDIDNDIDKHGYTTQAQTHKQTLMASFVVRISSTVPEY